MKEEVIEPFGFLSAFREHSRETGARFATRVVLVTIFVAGLGYRDGISLHMFLFVWLIFLSIGGSYWLANGLAGPYISWRRNRDRHVRELYERQLGSTIQVGVKRWDRVRLAVLDSLMVCLGLTLMGVLWGAGSIALGKASFGLTLMIGFTALAFLYLVIGALGGLRRGDEDFEARLHADVVYREVASGRGDLAGGLSVPIAAGEGGLSVTADAGALEDVVLDLDDDTHDACSKPDHRHEVGV